MTLVEQRLSEMEAMGLVEKRRDAAGNIVMRDGLPVFWLTEAGLRWQREHDPELH